jgi:uncharacterized protein
VKFWDSSAIVPLLVEERNSRECRDLSRADRHMVVWEYTETEVTSGLVKATRLTPPLSQDDLDGALERLDALAGRWEVVEAATRTQVNGAKERARQLMRSHELRAGDALQLAAAMRRFDPSMNRDFVVSDGKLADAAGAEGFNVIRLKFQRRRRGR